jgi:hypothetical protein
MKIKMLAAIAVFGLVAASTSYAAPSDSDNVGSIDGPTQLADNSSVSGNGAISGTGSMSGSSNMSGTSNNNMSGTPNNNMSGTSSPSDEGSADTATGDDY